MLKIKFRSLTYFFSFVLAFLVAGCTGPTPPTYKSVGSLKNLSEIQNLHAKVVPTKKTDMNKLHAQTLKDIAMSIGAQGGLAWRSKKINTLLTKNARYLDSIFNFNLMLLDHNVVPPILVQGNSSLNLADPQTLRIDDRVYEIVSQAHFTTAPPQWRNYLWMDYSMPEMPEPAFLPKTAEERAVWRTYVTSGWKDGINQANSIFTDSLARLTRDYSGMVLYRSLFLKGMVSKPFVAKTNLGVTGDDSNIHINDQIFRITSLPKLQSKASRWKPVVTRDNNAPAE